MTPTDGSESSTESGSVAPITATPVAAPPTPGLGGKPLTPLPGIGSAPPRRTARLWEQVKRSLVAVSLAFTLVMPVAMLLIERLHRDVRADEKMVALGLDLLFASIALMFLRRLTSLDPGESLAVESYWGGLGGGVGG